MTSRPSNAGPRGLGEGCKIPGYCGCGRPSAAPEQDVRRCRLHIGWQYLSPHERKIFNQNPKVRKRIARRGEKRYRARFGSKRCKQYLKKSRRYAKSADRMRREGMPGVASHSKGAMAGVAAKGFQPGGEKS